MSYTIITSSTSDDYKRPVNSVERIVAETLEDAKALAVIEYINKFEGYENLVVKMPEFITLFNTLNKMFGRFPYVENDEDEELAEQIFEKQREENLKGLPDLVEVLFNLFQNNESSLFQGEYIPSFFSLQIYENTPVYRKPNVNRVLENLFCRLEQLYESDSD